MLNTFVSDCISDDYLKDQLLYSTCRKGVLLKKARSQYMCWTPLLLDTKTSPPTEEKEQLLIQLQSSSRNTVFLMPGAKCAGLYRTARARGSCKTNK